MAFRCCMALLGALFAGLSPAAPAPFDLAGPELEVKVTRGAVTLPASQVPNFNSGDRIWIKADLPASQAAHYLLVAAFLSGSTNPPPESWFFPCKLWTGKCATEGLTVTAPKGAQQVLLFLAPQTGGDFKTLVSAVRGRPGAFVRTSQDLNQAALDRSRLEKFLAAIHRLDGGDPAKLRETAPLLARSLAIKIEERCLDRIPELQAPCLMQGHESLILSDGHSTSIVEALTSGPGSDLAMEASYMPQLSSTAVLPVDGAPLAFSTSYAHNLVLSVTGQDSKTIELPAAADPVQGGYVVDTPALADVALGDTVHASLKGFWGFEPYEGLVFRLINVHSKSWELAAGDEAALIVGRQDTIHLQADSVSCIDNIMVRDPGGKDMKVDWKTTRADEVELQLQLQLPLQESAPGAMTLLVTQYGAKQPQSVVIHTFADAGKFDGFAIHAGDSMGILKGTRLDQVTSLTFKGSVFIPGDLSSKQGADELSMVAQDPASVTDLKPEHAAATKISLKDGRSLSIAGSVEAPRPAATLIGVDVQTSAASDSSKIVLANPELPQDAVLTFSLRTASPAAFTRDTNIEVATGDESSTTTLNIGNDGLVLQNSHIAVATLNPAKAFGGSTFGPLQFRVIARGVAGDWQPLGNLVRLPVLKDLKCPPARKRCTPPESAARAPGLLRSAPHHMQIIVLRYLRTMLAALRPWP